MRNFADALNCAHLWGSREGAFESDKVYVRQCRSDSVEWLERGSSNRHLVGMALSFAACASSPGLQSLLPKTLELNLPALQTALQDMGHGGHKAA